MALHILLVLVTGGYALGSEPLGPLIVLLTLVTCDLLLGRPRLGEVPVARDAAILVLAVLVVYLATGKGSESGDTLPTRYLPVGLLRGQGFTLDGFPWLYSEQSKFFEPDDPDRVYYLRFQKGRFVSAYPPAPALLSLPVYLPSAWGGVPADSPLFATLEKLAGSGLVALSVGVLYLALRRVTAQPMALFATLAYALGSSNLSVNSQGLWQHGAGQLALCAALYCLVRGREQPAWIAYAGVPLALALVNRPLDVVIILPLCFYVLLHHRDQALRCALFGTPVVLLQLGYNAYYLGGPLDFPLGPILKHWPRRGGFRNAALAGVGRLLVSPSRGLLIYSPIFALSLGGMVLAWKRGGDRLVRWMSLSCLLLFILVSRWAGWWGGHTFGPRLLSDILPLLAFSLYPLGAWLESRIAARSVAAMLLTWSVAAHGIGAFTYDTWNADMDVNRQYEALWSWSNNQLVNPVRRLYNGLWVAFSSLPTSRTDDYEIDPTRMPARYWGAVWPKHPLEPGQHLDLAVRVKNESRVVWLTGGELRGRVRLGWRWWKGGREINREGRINLGRDLFPGQTYDLRFSVEPPWEPGEYGLEVGMVSEDVAWYSDHGSVRPLQFLVTVVAPADAKQKAPSL